jgi:hypothetical protein
MRSGPTEEERSMRVKLTAAAIAAAALLAVFAAACGGGGEEGGGSGTETVSMGTVRGSSADAAVFIGIEKGATSSSRA